MSENEGSRSAAASTHRRQETARHPTSPARRDFLAAAFDDGRGLIVSPTASPYIRDQGEVCFPQYKAMIDTALGYASP